MREDVEEEEQTISYNARYECKSHPTSNPDDWWPILASIDAGCHSICCNCPLFWENYVSALFVFQNDRMMLSCTSLRA